MVEEDELVDELCDDVLEIEDELIELVMLVEVAETLEVDDGLLVRTRYAPAPATTIITTKITAMTAGAIARFE